MRKNKYWPLDYDPESEIYETLAWDLPGFRVRAKKVSPNPHKPVGQHPSR